ncbi:MAG TPA: tRNA 2-thiouridine(34) synthase MnmA [Firmicutes bacterium]|nr:tRNA 2-thiouridine(34) synthase MnmA [Bacillota bacterium]
MNNFAEEKKVMVAMSGGVDSSVAALLLKEKGYAVVGVTLRLWVDPLAETAAGTEARGCCSLDAVSDARRVADMLDIPHYVLNMQDEFYTSIVSDFVTAYLDGRTPNPCIECNRTIKFFYLRRKAQALGINCLATGHYARIAYDAESGQYRLFKGIDRQKDQSYMLYILGQEELSSLLFPLGELTKQQVRKIAASKKLRVADKKESQEICFIPDNDYRAFLEREYPQAHRPGDIVSTSGRKLGRHSGIVNYTVGQRKGLGLTAPRPLYVVQIDARRNIVIVGEERETYSSGLMLGQLHFVSGNAPAVETETQVKIRYRAPAVPAILFPPADSRARVFFKEQQKAVTPGQSAVFYCGDEILGGGVIEAALPY